MSAAISNGVLVMGLASNNYYQEWHLDDETSLVLLQKLIVCELLLLTIMLKCSLGVSVNLECFMCKAEIRL